jgi:hypothetical protein
MIWMRMRMRKVLDQFTALFSLPPHCRSCRAPRALNGFSVKSRGFVRVTRCQSSNTRTYSPFHFNLPSSVIVCSRCAMIVLTDNGIIGEAPNGNETFFLLQNFRDKANFLWEVRQKNYLIVRVLVDLCFCSEQVLRGRLCRALFTNDGLHVHVLRNLRHYSKHLF